MSDWARFWARFGADRPALLSDQLTMTWGQLNDGCGELAAGLHREGLKKGDRLGCLMRNSPHYFELLLACSRIGVIFVPLNPLLTGSELEAVAGDAGLAALVTDATFVDALGPLEGIVGASRIFFVGEAPAGGRPLGGLRAHGRIERSERMTAADPAMICYTSGTTGRARGAVLTQGNLAGVAASAGTIDGLTYQDRAIVTVPLAFTGAGVSFGVPLMACGGSIVIRQELVPRLVLDDIETNGVSFIGVVPLVLERLAAEPDFDERDLSGLRIMKSGGAMVPEHLIRLYQSRGVGMVNAYGLTEGTGLNLELPAHEAIARLGSVGVALMGQDAMVVDDGGRPAQPGERGELLLSGACVMKEYWDDPEATAAALSDGWLRTGDIATVDEDGYFRIVDRSKDMIISGGINIYPAEIENVLAAHPDIVEIAVVGVPDDEWGETPVACVVTTNPDLDLAQLNDFAKSSLARFKQPRRLEIRTEPLPRGMSGKLLKRDIRAELVSRTKEQA
ncbi:class I adenylate-forming enzyme family protein [Microbacterium sp. NPDC055910]|uniref:class I adenylate-forming enzyme family protein n=1 Tax=Microbacterium sp. NPDC055910 TaxID=3345659 RepID=UPI0035DE2F88